MSSAALSARLGRALWLSAAVDGWITLLALVRVAQLGPGELPLALALGLRAALGAVCAPSPRARLRLVPLYAGAHLLPALLVPLLWSDPLLSALSALSALQVALTWAWLRPTARAIAREGLLTGATRTARGLAALPGAGLRAVFDACPGPLPRLLSGRRYRSERIAGLWPMRRAFVAFFTAPRGPGVEGAARAAWGRGDSPWTFASEQERPTGWFTAEGGPDFAPRPFAAATVLDWGRSRRNRPGSLRRRLRQFVVQPDPARVDVLLVRTFLKVGRARLPLAWQLLTADPSQVEPARPPHRGGPF